jgi:hypothetical protein
MMVKVGSLVYCTIRYVSESCSVVSERLRPRGRPQFVLPGQISDDH